MFSELVRILTTVKTIHLKYLTSINPDFVVILADKGNDFKNLSSFLLQEPYTSPNQSDRR
jgi:hypothetical protein